MNPHTIRDRLRKAVKPFHLHAVSNCASTNDYAMKLRMRGTLFAPAVVSTSRQVSGRGRGENAWWSNSDCMTATFAIAVDDAYPAHELPLIAGLAVRDAAAELSGNPRIELKWPNDVLFDGLKLAGLLCERIDNLDLIGIGLNVNLDPADAPPVLAKHLTSLKVIARKPIDSAMALPVVASHLWQAIQNRKKQPFSHFVREYERHHALLGKRISVRGDPNSAPVIGRVEGIDRNGRLLVRDGSKLHHVIAGHVTIL